jgi:hypothetical protein
MVSPFGQILEFPVRPPVTDQTFGDQFLPGVMELGIA